MSYFYKYYVFPACQLDKQLVDPIPQWRAVWSRLTMPTSSAYWARPIRVVKRPPTIWCGNMITPESTVASRKLYNIILPSYGHSFWLQAANKEGYLSLSLGHKFPKQPGTLPMKPLSISIRNKRKVIYPVLWALITLLWLMTQPWIKSGVSYILVSVGASRNFWASMAPFCKQSGLFLNPHIIFGCEPQFYGSR